jgi:hypothetical protein
VKFKLDENLDPRAREILAREGHDVRLVEEEGLRGAPDVSIGQVAIQEALCLVTLDLDFANVIAFPPHQYSGIIVLRHPHPTAMGRLWIVEPGRLRVHEPTEPWSEEDDPSGG